MSRPRARATAIHALLALGVASAVALVTGSPALRAIAHATRASPLPLAFAEASSLAGFAPRFALEVVTADGRRERRDLDASVYADLPGPYERRVAYGAALTYLPLVRSPYFEGVLRYGLCGDGPLARAAGVAAPITSATVVLPPRDATDGRERRATVACAR